MTAYEDVRRAGAVWFCAPTDVNVETFLPDLLKTELILLSVVVILTFSYKFQQ